MSRTRTALAAWLLSATLSTTGCNLVHQTSLLQKTRSQYYSLADAGVSEFHCDVTPDWDAFFTSVNNRPPDDTPWTRYIRQARLTFSAPLSGTSTVQWIAPSGPVPSGVEDKARTMQTSFHDMLAGFLQAWIPSLNNTLLPSIPISPITPKGTGYTLTEHDLEGRITDVTMDSQFHITHLSTRAPKFAAELDTKFIPSSSGLLLTELDTTTPGDPEHTIMRTTYATIDGVQVPSSLLILTSRSQIPMRFTHCAVRR